MSRRGPSGQQPWRASEAASANRVIVRLSTTASDVALTELERMAERVLAQ